MNIFVIRFINKDRNSDYLSSCTENTEEEAKLAAKEACDRWNDGTTFEVIEYTPLQK